MGAARNAIERMLIEKGFRRLNRSTPSVVAEYYHNGMKVFAKKFRGNEWSVGGIGSGNAALVDGLIAEIMEML